MSHSVHSAAGPHELILLGVCLLVVCGFELVNGFHDTANAVATVIYTRTLRPWQAVVISGLSNFAGVALGGSAVATSLIHLLPVELLASSGRGTALAMFLSLLLSAIGWNLGTWWLGLPASSTHTLVGAIVGVGVASSLHAGHGLGAGVHWQAIRAIALSLVVSPIFGLGFTALLVLLAKKLLNDPRLHQAPAGDEPPPGWIRAILIGTSGCVSFAHGSNDGQKGVGLIMAILMCLLPADFALDKSWDAGDLRRTIAVAEHVEAVVTAPAEVSDDLATVRSILAAHASVAEIPTEDRRIVRRKIVSIDAALAGLEAAGELSRDQASATRRDRRELRSLVDYAPGWVLALVATSLGVGTLIGWRRVVTTVGEKIGKGHMTYAHGASAQIVAAATIGASAGLGLPVSTTHVLSSGIAGAMLAERRGLHGSTVRDICIGWLLTLPVSMLLAGGFFLVFLRLVSGSSLVP